MQMLGTHTYSSPADKLLMRRQHRHHPFLLIIWLLVLLFGCALPPASRAAAPPSLKLSECAAQSTNKIWLPLIAVGRQFFVAPNGTPDGDGSREHPWNLAGALSGTYTVGPHDLISLRGGTYKGDFVSRLTGMASAPITVRQYQGERTIIDGSLKVKGEWTIYWGFEVMNSDLNAGRLNGIMVFGPHTKLINLIVHDSTGSGIGTWIEAPDSEIYGSIIYNNGIDKFNHGIYLQNQVGTKYIMDNIIFSQSGKGIQGYGLPGEYLRSFHIEGNVSFNNGTRSVTGPWTNILVGGDTPAEAMVLLNNYTYNPTALGEYNVDLGYDTSANNDITVKNNYFVGGNTVLHVQDWDRVTMTNNTLYGSANLIEFQLPRGNDPSTFQWDNNTYFADGNVTPFQFSNQAYTFSEWQQTPGLDQTSQYTSGRPTGAKIFVRPNKYEQGRAHIIVYNWDLLDTVDVDISNVALLGARYTVWNVQDYFGPPVASGIYDGTPIRLPMTGVPPPPPLRDTGSESPVTGPEFNVFVLTSTEPAAPSSTPAAIARSACPPISPSTPTALATHRLTRTRTEIDR
jgi:hypothetical protein